MTEFSADSARLRATELQMRRALGLQGDSTPTVRHATPSPASNGSQQQKRRFVRDGEVPVTLVHRNHAPDDTTVNQLDAARHALRTQTAAREKAERALADAQFAVRDLETKLAHERFAKDDAVRRVESERLAVAVALAEAQEQLAMERSMRETAERERDHVILERQALHEQLSKAAPAIARPAASASPAATPRRRGRPPKAAKPESDVVEWWVPGWKAKYR